ncbi:MAG: GntR family transcriptional regulator [Desulfobacterales bacterium]|nr:GntR family transcriptional regulator [Desulfobacterales bacterium]
MTKDNNNEEVLSSLKAIGERKSLGQHVLETLRQAIIGGNMAAGSRMVENRIAESLGISRTPVREALHKLEREGLIKKQPRGGFIVLGLDSTDIEETFGIRSILESYAARLAAENHRPEELASLEKKIEAYQKSLEKGETEALLRINTEFHDMLYALSRSPRLIRMINDLRDQIYRFRAMILKKETMAKASNEDHRQMINLMRLGDGESVEKLVRAHILRGRDAVLKDFDRIN